VDDMKTLDFAKYMQNRTKSLTIAIIKLARKLPRNAESKIIQYQLIKSGTSMAANYRAACRSRSEREFISKLNIVIEETDESAFWLELISELLLLKWEDIEPILNETNEILAIMMKSKQTLTSKK
jgi:four helix bundle protein